MVWCTIFGLLRNRMIFEFKMKPFKKRIWKVGKSIALRGLQNITQLSPPKWTYNTAVATNESKYHIPTVHVEGTRVATGKVPMCISWPDVKHSQGSYHINSARKFLGVLNKNYFTPISPSPTTIEMKDENFIQNHIDNLFDSIDNQIRLFSITQYLTDI